MKISDLVPPSLPLCFAPGYDVTQPDSFILKKIDVLKYIELLKSTQPRFSNSALEIFATKRIEDLGVGRNGDSIIK